MLIYGAINADVVELEFNEKGELWINVDGVCIVRIERVNKRVVVNTPHKIPQYVYNYLSPENERRTCVGRRQTGDDPSYAGSERRIGYRRK